eukprot:Skav234774  [mRNA]  locus=scaffold2396:351327:351851:- [translate_table: standard]
MSLVPDVTGSALSRVSRLAACGQALEDLLGTVPPSALETGGQAEANVLQHHLGISGKLREARQICNELKAEGFVVAPGDKIYVDPGVVPTLLATRREDPLQAAAGRAPPSGSSSSARNQTILHVRQNRELCDRLVAKMRQNLTKILEDKWTEASPKRPRTSDESRKKVRSKREL